LRRGRGRMQGAGGAASDGGDGRCRGRRRWNRRDEGCACRGQARSAGDGGAEAARGAARHGARVMVVESSGWVGGQMAGVPALEDTRPTLTSNTGFARELGDELVAYYTASGK